MTIYWISFKSPSSWLLKDVQDYSIEAKFYRDMAKTKKVCCQKCFFECQSMKKVALLTMDLNLGGKSGEKKKKKRIVKIAVHYPRASQQPERRPTGTASAHDNAIQCK